MSARHLHGDKNCCYQWWFNPFGIWEGRTNCEQLTEASKPALLHVA